MYLCPPFVSGIFTWSIWTRWFGYAEIISIVGKRSRLHSVQTVDSPNRTQCAALHQFEGLAIQIFDEVSRWFYPPQNVLGCHGRVVTLHVDIHVVTLSSVAIQCFLETGLFVLVSIVRFAARLLNLANCLIGTCSVTARYPLVWW